MILSTFEISSPNNDTRKEHHIPLSLIVSPCEELKNPINMSPELFPRCNNCRGYFSSFCSKTPDNKWICSLCGSEQSYDFDKPMKLDQIQENIWFDLSKQTKQINYTKSNEILVFYLSLEFHQSDLNIIKPLLSQYLYKHKEHKCIFILSQIDGKITLLCPDTIKFDINNGTLITKETNNEEDKDECTPKTTDTNENIGELCSSMKQYSSLSMIDLKNHIFSPDQIEMAANTISMLQNSGAFIPFSLISLSASLICDQLFNEDIRLIAIIPKCNIPEKSRNIIKDAQLDGIKNKNIRIDILIPQIDFKSQTLQHFLPGIIIPFSRYDLPLKLDYLLQHSCEYQVYMNVRTKNCTIQWHKTPLIQQDIDGTLMYTKTCFEHQPFVLDVKHIENDEKDCIVQITIKTSNKFYILNKRIMLDNNCNQIAKTINLKALEWIWLTRAIGKAGAVEAVKEAASAVCSFIKNSNSLNEERITKTENELKAFISNIDNYQCFKNDLSLTILYLSITHPNYIDFLPRILVEGKKEVAYVLNEIYANISSRELTKKVKEIGICGDISSCIPDWFSK